MTDRKKVMGDLEGLTFDDWRMFHSDSEVQITAKNALQLLKEQEAEQPIVHENSYGWKFYYCPRCKQEFYQIRKQAYCDKCGKAVKWE